MSSDTPPPLQQGPGRSFSVDDFIQSERQDDQQQESDLSEEELRQLYDQEEIERFLRLFSDYVNEVQLPEVPKQHALKKKDASNVMTAEDGEWTPVQEDLSSIFSISNMSPHDSTKYSSYSEEIACRYVAPFLPGPRPPIPEFTFGRLRLALERIYLFVLPIYLPFFYNLKSLATWEDPFTSTLYCAIYWTLWWYNLLFPALVGRILFSLVRRKLWPYPSLEDLRNHRTEIDEADRFGEMMTAKMSSSSVITELWRLFRLADQTMKITRKKHVKGKETIFVDDPDSQSAAAREDKGVIDNMETERDVKRYGLFLLDEIVDLHERIRNIFIWRKPVSSQRYGIALASLFLVSLLPAKHIAKLTFFGFGFLFWHVSPVIAGLPHSEKRRIPSPFSDVPTDAEYAMNLISQRVAAGLDVNPVKMGKMDTGSKYLRGRSEASQGATGIKKTLLDGFSDAKKLHPGRNPVPGKWPPVHALLTTALSIAQPQATMETHTYPCQHSSGPGLITLTHKSLFFTPLMSHNAKLVIPLSAVKGVKKAGMMKGVLLRWADPTDESQEQKEEKFHWVGSRDELFARLIGIEGRRWMKV